MGETPAAPQPRPPGPVRIRVMVLILSVFVVKVVRWWLGVSTGASALGTMTGWEWAKVIFYHLAVLAGVVGVIQMIAERNRAGTPTSPDDPSTGAKADGR